MGIGIIQNHSQYKNICGNYTYHMPAPVCQSKMKDLGDEFVLTEKMMETIIFIVMPLRGHLQAVSYTHLTKRTDVYNNLYRKMSKKDRLAAGYTLEKYERIYRQAFYDAAKKADPNWEIGKPIKDGALDSVTRETAESGKSPAQATLDTKI